MRKIYRAPSAKRLQSEMGLSLEQAEKVRGLLQGILKTRNAELFPKSNAHFNHCYNEPRFIDRLLVCLNEVCETFGVECVTTGEQRMDGSHIKAEYLNAGDTYNTTLLYNHNSDSFSLTSWGDFVERNNL